MNSDAIFGVAAMASCGGLSSSSFSSRHSGEEPAGFFEKVSQSYKAVTKRVGPLGGYERIHALERILVRMQDFEQTAQRRRIVSDQARHMDKIIGWTVIDLGIATA